MEFWLQRAQVTAYTATASQVPEAKDGTCQQKTANGAEGNSSSFPACKFFENSFNLEKLIYIPSRRPGKYVNYFPGF